jgi:hypothetical protein
LPNDKRKDVCNSIVPEKVDEILKQLGQNKTRNVICAGFGYAHSFGASREIGKTDCEKIVTSVKKEILANPAIFGQLGIGQKGPPPKLLEEDKPQPSQTPGKGLQNLKPGIADFRKRFLPDVLRERFTRTCKNFTGPEKGLCHLISRLVHRNFAAEQIGNMTASDICTKLAESRFLTLTDGPTNFGDGIIKDPNHFGPRPQVVPRGKKGPGKEVNETKP